MADYYSILNKTISGLARNTPEVREVVYNKARAAIEKQLRGLSPPPGEAAIESQLKLLEEAIIVIEAENVEATGGAAVETQIAEPEPAISETPVAEEAPLSADSDPETASLLDAEPDAEPSEPPTVDNLDPIMPVQAEEAPEVSPEQIAETQAAQAGGKKGLVRKLVTYLVILGLLGGGGYALWLNQNSLIEMATSTYQSLLGGASDVKEEEEKPAPETETVNQEKEPVRIGEDGEDKVAEEPEQEPQTEPVTQPPVVLQPETETAENNEPEQPVVEPVQEEEPETPENNQASIPIGEVAYLYEEGSGGSGATRTTGGIIWELVRQKPNESLPPEPVITGKMDVPEKGIKVTFTIKRNTDDALSASHLIDMQFEIPPDFEGQGIETVSRVVMKSTEEARGEQLVAVPVKVSEGFFLIALDNLEQAVNVNTQLLTQASWIDVPITYTTGKRALLTLEKGGTGQRMFDEAFNEWKNK